MNFADELRRASQLTYTKLKDEKRNVAAVQEAQERRENIFSGKLVATEYARLKEDTLFSAVVTSASNELSRERGETVIPDNSSRFYVLYKAEEYKIMRGKVFHSQYNDKLTQLKAYFEFTKKHCVFSKEEVEEIQNQLAKRLKEDGLNYEFTTKEFYNEKYEESFLWGVKAVKTDLCGYELSVTVSW